MRRGSGGRRARPGAVAHVPALRAVRLAAHEPLQLVDARLLVVVDPPGGEGELRSAGDVRLVMAGGGQMRAMRD